MGFGQQFFTHEIVKLDMRNLPAYSLDAFLKFIKHRLPPPSGVIVSEWLEGISHGHIVPPDLHSVLTFVEIKHVIGGRLDIKGSNWTANPCGVIEDRRKDEEVMLGPLSHMGTFA